MVLALLLIRLGFFVFQLTAEEVINPELEQAREENEMAQLTELQAALAGVNTAELRDPNLINLDGSHFWTVANQRGLFGVDLHSKLISHYQEEGAGAPLPATSVSYTGPKAATLALLRQRTGPKSRCPVHVERSALEESRRPTCPGGMDRW